jgi:hypothetical protein
MTFMLVIHAALGLLGSAYIFSAFSQVAALSFLAGAFLSFINLVALVVAGPRILAKKQVARAVAIIVFKFAILGWIMYEVVAGKFLHLGWFAVGLGTVIASVVATSFKTSPKAES